MRKSTSHQEENSSVTALADVLQRGGEIIHSMQRDALLLARVHQELAAVIIRLCDQAIGARAPTEPALPADPATPRALRILDVSKRVGLSRSSIWKMVKEGDFPAPCRLSRRSVGWFELDIEPWLRSRRS